MLKLLARSCVLVATMVLLAGNNPLSIAADAIPSVADDAKFCNLIFVIQGNDSIFGLHRFHVDAAKNRGLLGRLRMTVVLGGFEPENAPRNRRSSAAWSTRVTNSELSSWNGRPQWPSGWASPRRNSPPSAAKRKAIPTSRPRPAIRWPASHQAHACVEGQFTGRVLGHSPQLGRRARCSLTGSQWDEQTPADHRRVNRELDENKAVLELHWASRTLWHNYDRFPIPQCWHFGEPLKRNDWSVGPVGPSRRKGRLVASRTGGIREEPKAGRTPLPLPEHGLGSATFSRPGAPGGRAWIRTRRWIAPLDMMELLLARGWRL